MKITKHRIFFVWEYDKEENWLNQMADEGWLMTKIRFCAYTFEKGEPGSYQYRLEYLKDADHSEEGVKYRQFLEEAGIEKVGQYLSWAYYRRKNDGNSFEIFSDTASKINHLKRIRSFMLLIAGFYLGFNLILGAPGHAISNFMFVLLLLVLLYGVFRIQNKINDLEKTKDILE